MESLLTAWDEFKVGKSEKADVQVFERHLEDNLFRLHRDLAQKRYQHGSYHGFHIRDPKVRHIHKAPVRDRIVHHALCKYLNAIFEPTFIPDSYSARTGKGTHRAVERLRTFARKVEQTHGRCVVMKCDIKKFFAALDHKTLLDIIIHRVKDSEVLWLIRNIVESFSSECSRPGEPKGAPIGNLTSQLFANIYLNEFDQFLKHALGVKYYIRYTDDFVIAHHERNYLLALMEEIASFLHTRLKLSLHPHKVHVRKFRQGVDFLGYVTLPHARVLRTKTNKRMFRKLRERVRQFKEGVIAEKEFLQSVSAYLGVLSHANAHDLEGELRHKLWEWLREPQSKQKGTADLLPTLTETLKGSNCGGAAAPSSPQLDF